jgi:hypothetical protein
MWMKWCFLFLFGVYKQRLSRMNMLSTEYIPVPVPEEDDKNDAYHLLLLEENKIKLERNKGEDMRPSIEELSPQKIVDNHRKHAWLTLLQSNLSNKEKVEFIEKNMEDTYKAIDVRAGGLLRDW